MSTSFRHSRRLVHVGTIATFVLGVAVRCYAQAGPPYQTDDPDPVPYHHFEAYVFVLSDRTSAGTALAGPSFEMNWGAAPNLQLHLVVPFVTSLTPGAPAEHGLGDIELGAKYRFVKEGDRVPEIGVFPFIELPAGDASRGLGVGTTWYRIPIWIKKCVGAWSLYGGGGAVLVRAEGDTNYGFASGLLQRKVNDRFTLGAELVGHGSETSDPTSIGRSLMMDIGGFYSFTQGFQLLMAAGHSVAWQPETYTYVAAYWTWGKDAGGQAGPGPLALWRARK